ncbi:MAG: divalent-cation tolerance protein CutA [Acidobacteria bacterium]|jgi:periplasmic divalent cation tolerance protein|nr:MAG: divalent-cation tolerance protein CutA [Acidobacteriota bacterium]
MFGYYVVLITVPVDRAQELASYIIENRLGACVNVVQDVNSIYWWKGNIERDKESLLVVKTSALKFAELLKGVKSVHPYTVPEIIALPIVAGNKDYLKWIDDSLG